MNESIIAPTATATSPARSMGWLVHVGAVIVAAVLVAALYWIATKVGDPLVTKPELGPGDAERLPLRSALIATVVSGVVWGPGAVAIANRFARQPTRVFTVFALGGLIVYGIVAFLRAEAISTALWFNVMHLAAAAPILGSLFRRLRLVDKGTRDETSP